MGLRRRRQHVEHDEEAIDLAPMLDFVLNLLIFFIITNTFVTQAGIQINRPTAQTAVRFTFGHGHTADLAPVADAVAAAVAAVRSGA